MKKIILLNIVFFIVLMCIFLVAAFSMGYAANNRFGTDAGILYLLVVTLHLFLNYLVMHRQQGIASKKILFASAAILCIYLLVLFH
ncbi:MAG: hypothetical protein ABI813_14020 [Bacteroidota bacterium]